VARAFPGRGSVGRTSLLRNRQCWEGYPKDGMNCPRDVIKKNNAGY
jgi:hypothetical protein